MANIALPNRSSGRDPELSHAQTDVAPDACEGDTSQVIEMAAEQLADLLWRHWLYLKDQEKKETKKPRF